MNLSWLSKKAKKILNRNTQVGRLPATARLSVEVLEQRSLMAASPLQQINHFVVIYQENWSFDALYGNFPGANGTANASPASLTQIDRVTGQPLSTEATNNPAYTYDPTTLQNPPPPLTSSHAVDTRFLTNPANPNSPTVANTLLPYNLSQFVGPSSTTGDIVHRYFQQQSQINGGTQNGYVTWSDNPGLVMSQFDATNMPEGLLAQQYTMDDNFFHAAFGGSFLNHQFLVSAAAPVYPNAATVDPSDIATLAPNGSLALNSAGQIVHDGNITPIGGQSLADPGNYYYNNYAINTIYSDNLIPAGTTGIAVDPTTGRITLPAKLLPSQNDNNPNAPNYIPNIGDSLDNAGVGWKWYSGGWDSALASSPSNPANNGTTPANVPVDPNFQWHHQPLAYDNNFAPFLYDPTTGKFVVNNSPTTFNADGSKHLTDENNFFDDLSTGNLPAVSFIKQIGEDNEHPGYASLLEGQQSTADIVHAIQNSPDWAHTAIIITYDENGGRWDHVISPDNNGIWGDGTRVPTIVISPYSKKGFVDHTEHDTLSILKTIEQRFNLPALNSLDANASSLASDFQLTPHASIGSAYVQPDANNLGKFTLIVQGTEGDDHMHISLDNGELHVQIDGSGVHFDQFFAQPISRLEVYGQGGDDHVQISSQVTQPAMIFGGAGNDHIETGSGNTVVVGGDNHIEAGTGRNLLIGGTGDTHIDEDGGQAIEIAGTTFYDANLEALTAIENEWASTDDLLTRVAKITNGVSQDGSNTKYHLAADTVFANGHHNHLDAGSGMDWFFANPWKDDVDSFIGQDDFTAIKRRP